MTSSNAWLQIQIELERGAGIECDPAPGRILIVGPTHTFLDFAESIDDAFARWDVAHLHAFELSDGRLIGIPDDPPAPGGSRWLDHRKTRVADVIEPGDEFAYTFDLVEEWEHRCHVMDETVDPLAAYGARPSRPAIVFGWGWIPDQYGRTGVSGADIRER